MRILIAIGSMHPSQGGPPGVVVGHALILRELGHEVTVVSPTIEHQRTETETAWLQMSQAGVNFRLFACERPYALGRSRSLRQFIDQTIREFDVVHMHGVWEHSLAYLARVASAHSIPYAFTPHGMLDRWSRQRASLKKNIARYVFGSQFMLTHACAAQFGTVDEQDEAADLRLPYQSFIIRNGVDPAKFSISDSIVGEQIAERFPNLANADPLIVFFSRMHIKKGVDILLDAIKILGLEFPEARYLIAAIAQDSQYENEMREKAALSPVADSITITTKLTGPAGAAVLQQSDVFVLPSRQEGFSIAILEAMASELPIVITKNCHLEFIEKIEAGFETEATPESYVVGLRKMLKASSESRQKMGQNGRKWVTENCTWPVIGNQLVAMYETILDSKRSGL